MIDPACSVCHGHGYTKGAPGAPWEKVDCPTCAKVTAVYVPPPTEERVNHPKHYNLHPSGVECIAIVEHMTFNVGSAVKYLWRAGLKGAAPTAEDLQKARWYIDREIERLGKT